MRLTKRHLFGLVAVIVIAFFLSSYKLPYYIYKPGGADALNPIVEVADGYESSGDMHLVTVSGGQATPIQYLLSMVLPHHEIRDLAEVFPDDITREEYMHAQLEMMENSQEASMVVAYQAANANIQIDYNGVYVAQIFDQMPAQGVLESGDQIIQINGQDVNKAADMIEIVDQLNAGDPIELVIKREEATMTKQITLVEYENQEGKIGIGVGLVTDRHVEVDPKVTFSSGRIGGPSAGLMFSLEIYDQLTEEDVTKGYQVAGTGQIDYEGNVYRIGGVDKKVVAADREGCDIFFAPNEQGDADSNYQAAVKKAAEIGTDMEIVPVDTFNDALDYLSKQSPAS
ncbi:SepM family pheromone-processing serine protease [Lentibacillus saliphilus]|uniref:SepM family pheromone-processing serine protease n=1 Tax=Lentibacillus saliphilus TaxID=2737028 RepID=UPI001C310F36|nr:SepM family pheromone-processing serine protease [Lentibacillus saliphilus]